MAAQRVALVPLPSSVGRHGPSTGPALKARWPPGRLAPGVLAGDDSDTVLPLVTHKLAGRQALAPGQGWRGTQRWSTDAEEVTPLQALGREEAGQVEVGKTPTAGQGADHGWPC